MDPTTLWIIFGVLLLGILALDLGVFNRNDHVIDVRECIRMSFFYVALATAFGGFLWYEQGAQKGAEFFTAYVVEFSLSLDNIFVIALIMGYFGIPEQYRHRILFWGIIGALVFRGIAIGMGAAIVHEFHYVLYGFGVLLLYTAFKMITNNEDETPDFGNSRVYRMLKKMFNITTEYDGNKFFTRKNGVLMATPLFIALVMVEFADIAFATDSIPAVFAITQDPFIVYTSNIFAIMGLRSLFFALQAALHRFEYLKYAISAVLGFIGIKLLVMDLFPIPSNVSLAVTLGLLSLGVIVSLFKTRNTVIVEAGSETATAEEQRKTAA
jgi:tellurite resistance protein TerC